MKIEITFDYDMARDGAKRVLKIGEIYDAISWNYLPDYIKEKFDSFKEDIINRRCAVVYMFRVYACLNSMYFIRLKDWEDYGAR
jgi:hypothetical protein